MPFISLFGSKESKFKVCFFQIIILLHEESALQEKKNSFDLIQFWLIECGATAYIILRARTKIRWFQSHKGRDKELTKLIKSAS